MITCFSWCRVPGCPLRIVAGTKEGYIALFDLTNISSPVLILMNSGHPTIISSIDWSVTDPNKIITASFDNTVMMWLLDNMYARTVLLHSRLPFLCAQWLHSSVSLSSMITTAPASTTPFSNNQISVWDPVGAVIAVDESNLAKIVLLNEPGRVITLASNAPRMVCLFLIEDVFCLLSEREKGELFFTCCLFTFVYLVIIFYPINHFSG